MTNSKLNNYQTQQQQIMQASRGIYLVVTLAIISAISQALDGYRQGDPAEFSLAIWQIFNFSFWLYLTARISAHKLKALAPVTQEQKITAEQSFWWLTLSFYLSVILVVLPQQIYLLHLLRTEPPVPWLVGLVIIQILLTVALVVASYNIYQLIAAQQKFTKSLSSITNHD